MNTLLYLLLAVLGAGAVVVLVPMALNAATPGPLRFTEEPGENHWFGPAWRRFRFYWGLTLSGNASMKVVFEEPVGDPDSSFKVFGLSAISPRILWPWAAERVQRYGWAEYPDLAHGYSARWVARFDGKYWHVSTYTYVEARGGISGPGVEKPPRRTLAKVKPGEPVQLTISIEGGELTYRAESRHTLKEQRMSFPAGAWAYMKHFAHSKGVTPDTAVPIAFTASK